MKKHIYLFSVIMLASTLFMAAPANASTITVATVTSNNSNSWLGDLLGLLGLDGPSGSGNTGNTGNTGGSGTQLPINNGLMFLMAAGVVIGITAIKKNKLIKLA
ncbi:hypothetical protein HDF18_04595 [Mucilaginibacter sp. X5P1]|uniref:hypothetical protein n=1 Tax=Mucilaginibacter sp. X5P1 TaxID=2723088 RepID=UPI001613ED58|nr:hypothetical protein [Mucilaginibacter sp. X5P1]MBB6136900.1 hypothetical protein [Mucilaginibacter sp. X5P1]